MFNHESFRKNFPELDVKVHDRPLVYFDNAASSLKHAKVIARVDHYQKFEAANVHRGAHQLSHKGTLAYENARKQVCSFVGAADPREIVFTRGTTESINLVASAYGEQNLGSGDEILISSLEHHSNIVPWQILSQKTGAKLKVVPLDKETGLSLTAFRQALSSKTKLVSVLWYSNAFGIRLPIEDLVKEAQAVGAKVLVDAAQVPVHEKIAVQDLGADFLVFSGHKLFAPYGIGVLFGKTEVLESMKPYQSGGSMIDRVSFEQTTYADIPQKFEAGTPNVSGAIGLGEACQIIESDGVESWHRHIQTMRATLNGFLSDHKDYELYDFETEKNAGVVSFNHKRAHSSDVGTLLDKFGFAVRAGHHCCQPLMAELGIAGTVRVSFAPYNSEVEVESLVRALDEINEFF